MSSDTLGGFAVAVFLENQAALFVGVVVIVATVLYTRARDRQLVIDTYLEKARIGIEGLTLKACDFGKDDGMVAADARRAPLPVPRETRCICAHGVTADRLLAPAAPSLSAPRDLAGLCAHLQRE